MAHSVFESIAEFPSDEALGNMLTEAGSLIAGSGRKALEKNWPDACMDSMKANQLMSRVIKTCFIRDKVQTASIAALKAELAASKDEVERVVGALNLVSGQAVDWKEKLVAMCTELNELRARTSVCMGVGDGHGSLFVYGNHESIMAARALVKAAGNVG